MYGIAEEFKFDLILLAMPWPWGIDMLDSADSLTANIFTPTGCIVAGDWGEGGEK